ncbi:T9SS type A sorting domain-containing protein [Candidatus Latescibacterota bacterium]
MKTKYIYISFFIILLFTSKSYSGMDNSNSRYLNRTTAGAIDAFAENWPWSQQRNQDGKYAECRLCTRWTSPDIFDPMLNFYAYYTQTSGDANFNVYISTSKQVHVASDGSDPHYKDTWWVGDSISNGDLVYSGETQHFTYGICRISIDVSSYISSNPIQDNEFYYIAFENLTLADLVIGDIYIGPAPVVTTVVEAPTAPILVSPTDSATEISTNSTLAWNSSDGATSYQLHISIISDFSTTVVDESGITSNSFQVSEMENSTQYFWRINATNEGGTSEWSNVWSFITELPISVEQISNKFPNKFRLGQNFPNPFNPTTTIEFDLPKSGFVTLKVYNTLGEEVITIISKYLHKGKYSTELNLSSLASGIYVYRLQSDFFVQSKKMSLVR